MEIECIGQASRSNDVEDFSLAENIYRLRVFKEDGFGVEFKTAR